MGEVGSAGVPAAPTSGVQDGHTTGNTRRAGFGDGRAGGVGDGGATAVTGAARARAADAGAGPGPGGTDWLESAKVFAELGRELSGGDSRTALDRLPHLALQQLPAATCASVTTLRRGVFRTVAATDAKAEAADTIQYELNSGPCVDAIVADTLAHPIDLRRDPRWPEFGARVGAEQGLHSMLSFRLVVEELIAALNIYAEPPGAFTDHDIEIGLLLAVHGGLALSVVINRDRAAHLERALRSNRDIGVAVGILMALYRLPRDEAFDLLRIASQRLNRKIRDLALDIIDTGSLPDLPPPPPRDSPSG